MRHRNFGKKLGRNTNQRKALFKNLALAVFTYGAIETTEARAKGASRFIEKLSRYAVLGDINSRRQLLAVFQDRNLVNLLSSKMGTTFSGHIGSFLKTEKIKRRQGDDALIVKLSLVKPFDLKKEVKAEEPKSVKKSAIIKKPVAVKKTKVTNTEKI